MKAYSVDLRSKIVAAHKRAEAVDQKNSRNICLQLKLSSKTCQATKNRGKFTP
jgi:hypothetical protein